MIKAIKIGEIGDDSQHQSELKLTPQSIDLHTFELTKNRNESDMHMATQAC